MKTLGLIVVLVCSSFFTRANLSGIAIQADGTSKMLVYVNGKLYNKQAGNFVRIASKPGLFHIQVKVVNPFDKEWYLVRKDIRVEKGYEFYYKIVFSKDKRPQILAIKRYPVYSRYFLNPILYNSHPVS